MAMGDKQRVYRLSFWLSLLQETMGSFHLWLRSRVYGNLCLAAMLDVQAVPMMRDSRERAFLGL